MTQRPVSTLAMLFGILTVVGVLLPWHSHVVYEENGGADLISALRGYEGEFNGLITLILAAIGTAMLVWFMAMRTGPALSRMLLTVAVLAFGVGIGLTALDLMRELPEQTITVGSRTESQGRAFGIILTIVAGSVAFLMTGITVLSPKTPYRD